VSRSSIAIDCWLACKSHPISLISASFNPSAVRWTPHSLRGSDRGRRRYDITVYAGELEVCPPGAPTIKGREPVIVIASRLMAVPRRLRSDLRPARTVGPGCASSSPRRHVLRRCGQPLSAASQFLTRSSTTRRGNTSMPPPIGIPSCAMCHRVRPSTYYPFLDWPAASALNEGRQDLCLRFCGNQLELDSCDRAV
jgi:hypothetical protein